MSNTWYIGYELQAAFDDLSTSANLYKQSTKSKPYQQKSITMADNSNPGNFSNRPKEEVQNIASKGGQTGTENSGFASMPKEKVVC